MAGALGLVLTGNTVPMEGSHAIPVYVDDSLPIVGPSRACVVITTEVPMAGGPPMAVRLAPAGTPAIGPAIPVYVVPGGGSLSSGVAPAYQLLDQFTTNAAAPLATPRTCEPGPGTLTVRDTGNAMSIVGSVLTTSGGASSWGDPSLRTPATLARADGRAILCRVTKPATTTFGPVIGWSTNTDLDHDNGRFNQGMLAFWNSAWLEVRIGGAVTQVGSYSAGVAYTIAVVLHSGGFISCVSGGAFATFPQMTVKHISTVTGTNNFFGAIADYNAAITAADDLRIVDLGGQFANSSYYGTLSVNDVITFPNM